MIKNILILLVCLFAIKSFAVTSIVYGDDNRIDIVNLHNSKILKLSKSIAGRVAKKSLYSNYINYNTYAMYNVPSLSTSMNVCPSERFSKQPTAVDCTGFLVGDDLLVTAGHCMIEAGRTVVKGTSDSCDRFSWMFDYKTSSDGSVDLTQINRDSVYNCKSVIYAKYDRDEDFALIKLQRKVTGRRPLKLNRRRKIRRKTKLFVMGHPSGLPLKYADGAKVFEVRDHYFSTNLDTFGGNSGSPVFNRFTLEVEGILVRGDIDYITKLINGGKNICMMVNTCNSHRRGCDEDDPAIRGEHVTKISEIFRAL